MDNRSNSRANTCVFFDGQPLKKYLLDIKPKFDRE